MSRHRNSEQENSREAYAALNEARQQVGLPPIRLPKPLYSSDLDDEKPARPMPTANKLTKPPMRQKH